MKTDFQNKADFSQVIKFIFNSEKQKSRLDLKSLKYPSKWLQFLFAMAAVCLMTSASKFLQSYFKYRIRTLRIFWILNLSKFANLLYWSCFIYFSQKFFCTMGHRNFCTEALLQKFLYPIVQKISEKSRWNKLWRFLLFVDFF